jgi:hypothetical protein
MFPFDVGEIVSQEPGNTVIEILLTLLQHCYDLFLFLVYLII